METINYYIAGDIEGLDNLARERWFLLKLKSKYAGKFLTL